MGRCPKDVPKKLVWNKSSPSSHEKLENPLEEGGGGAASTPPGHRKDKIIVAMIVTQLVRLFLQL